MSFNRNSLEIRLTESVVFLRTGDGTGRTRHGTQPTAPPAMVRGLLTLNIVKPIKISSIEIELTGKTSTSWPEGVFTFVVMIMSIDSLAYIATVICG